MKQTDLRRSVRQTLRTDGNAPVLALSLSYGEGEVALGVEILDRKLYLENRDEAQAALYAFVEDMNRQLEACGLPRIGQRA